jgi:hypothetical protein
MVSIVGYILLWVFWGMLFVMWVYATIINGRLYKLLSQLLEKSHLEKRR